MVKTIASFFLLLLCFSLTPFLEAQEVKVEASIDGGLGYANTPLIGTITITHETKTKIDAASFQLDSKPLSTEKIKEVKISNDAAAPLISIYSFNLPAQEKGLYILNPVSVKIDGKTYASSPTSYQVKAEVAVNASAAASSQPSRKTQRTRNERPRIAARSSSPFLRLNSFVKDSPSLYPGQRAQLVYQITYNRSVDLTYSLLPLTESIDFRKIGDEHIEETESESSTNPVTVQEISQEIEADKPGVFEYGPSAIEGYAYENNESGEKVYYRQKLRAEAPIVTITVNPFPLQDRPASFTGALGTVEAKLSMLTSSTIPLGEQIKLELEVSGLSNLDSFKLPILACQPGFSGFFYMNDLPAAGEVKDSTKKFTIELRPISSFVTEIPVVELSSFDTNTHVYHTWQSQPIPLTVQQHFSTEAEKQNTSIVVDSEALHSLWLRSNQQVTPLAIAIQPVGIDQAFLKPIQRPVVLLFFPLAAVLLGLQLFLKQWWLAKRIQTDKITSQTVLKQALKEKRDKNQLLKGIQHAFNLKLQETGASLSGPAKEFIDKLEAFQYGHSKMFEMEALKKEARQLFDRLT